MDSKDERTEESPLEKSPEDSPQSKRGGPRRGAGRPKGSGKKRREYESPHDGVQKGSRDFRPIVVKFMQSIRVFDVLWEELQKYGEKLSIRDRLYFYKDLARMGLEASPKTVEQEGGKTVTLIVQGLAPKPDPIPIEGEIVQEATPSLPPTPPKEDLSYLPGSINKERRPTVEEWERRMREEDKAKPSPAVPIARVPTRQEIDEIVENASFKKPIGGGVDEA